MAQLKRVLVKQRPQLSWLPLMRKEKTAFLAENLSLSRARICLFLVYKDALSRLVDAVQQAGRYEIMFDASDLPSGVYIYRLETANAQLTKSMLLTK